MNALRDVTTIDGAIKKLNKAREILLELGRSFEADLLFLDHRAQPLWENRSRRW